MNNLDRYYEISNEIYMFITLLMTAYCYVSLIKPFFSYKPFGHLQKLWGKLVIAAYACIMLFLHYMPYYINAILAHAIGIFGTFFVICLLDPVYISQKFFLSFTFFSLRWQVWRIVGHSGMIWTPLYIRFFSDQDETFWFHIFIMESVWDVLFGFFLMYGGSLLLLKVYGKKQEHMSAREFFILLIPSLSGLCAYVMIMFYYNAYTSVLEQATLPEKIGYDILIPIYAVICYATTLSIIWIFRQWKSEQEEDKQWKIFSSQMQDLKSHITETERLYRDMRALRHDMGNHLMTIKNLYTQGESEAAEAYTVTLQEQMKISSSEIASGNPITDVILSEKKKEMEEKGIAFLCDFHYPTDSGINAFDISIILNNGLSNAIEAIEKEYSPAPHIFLSSCRMKNMYVIEIVNSYRGEWKTDEQSGLPITTKEGKGHGFGLSSVRHAARKYLGDIEISKEIYKEEDCFVLRVMLQTVSN